MIDFKVQLKKRFQRSCDPDIKVILGPSVVFMIRGGDKVQLYWTSFCCFS